MVDRRYSGVTALMVGIVLDNTCWLITVIILIFFLNLGMSLTFVKLISLQAEYRKLMPKTTVRFVF